MRKRVGSGVKQVDPQLYAGISRGERRRIAKRLQDLKRIHNDGLADAARLHASQPKRTLSDLILKRRVGDGTTLALAKMAEHAVNPYQLLQLMACQGCLRPVEQCLCRNADGSPLQWEA